MSQASASLLRSGLGFDAERIVVIPNGVCTDRFRPASTDTKAAARRRFGVSADEFVVVSTGAFRPVKRHAALVEAFAGVLSRGVKGRLILAGFGELEKEIRGLVRQKEMSNQVLFPGWLEDVRGCLAAADAYVCASRFEGLSNSVLEALAAGLPCVVTDVSDHHRMFASIDPGYVVPVDDSGAMERKLVELAQDATFRQELGRRGRGLVEQHYAFATAVAAYEALYEQAQDPLPATVSNALRTQ